RGAGGVRHERPADRHPVRQPRRHRVLRRPRPSRPTGRRLRPPGAVRGGRRAGGTGHRRGAGPGERGAGRRVGARQGRHPRRRRRPGLRQRRARRRGRRGGRRVLRGGPGPHRVPDRGDRRRARRRPRPRVPVARHRALGAGGARFGGLRAPVTRQAAPRTDDHDTGVGLPRLLWVPAALAFALIALPVVGLAVRADWPRLPELLLSESALDALRLSLLTAAISTTLCVLFGGPLAVVLARGRVRGLRVLRSVVLLPLVLPPVVGGLALLFLLGRTGFVGRSLYLAFGITVPFTTAAVVLAQ